MPTAFASATEVRKIYLLLDNKFHKSAGMYSTFLLRIHAFFPEPSRLATVDPRPVSFGQTYSTSPLSKGSLAPGVTLRTACLLLLVPS